MARRPTIRDVAKAAGVSVATVNRVIAGGEGVREETAAKVAEAAERIGFHRRTLIGLRLSPERPEVKLGVVLQKQGQAFYQQLAAELARAADAYGPARIRLRIGWSQGQSPSDAARNIRETAEGADVLAGIAVNHHDVTAAVDAVADRGVPTMAILSDFAQGTRRLYLGLNNLRVGRGAARAIAGRVRAGKVALFVGGHRWHGHDLREAGFRSVIREHAPGATLLDTLVNLETRQLTYEATLGLMDRHRDLAGIYLAGGGMEGTIAALREERGPGEIALVVNEPTPESLAALEDGYAVLVIETPLGRLCAEIMALAHRLHGGDDTATGQTFLDPVLRLPEFA
ncbi:MAG: LacI family DNA-binding transcriptional regulator [Hasllibacter sp.]